MQQKRTILTVLTALILIVIGLRYAGYREYIPSPVMWILVGIHIGISYLWKPNQP